MISKKDNPKNLEDLNPVKTTSDCLIPSSQIREVVRILLAEIQIVPGKQWYDTTPAYSLLGLDSAGRLRMMVRDGTLRLGIEVRDIRLQDAIKPHYQFHISKCEARFLEPPEKRSYKRSLKKLHPRQ